MIKTIADLKEAVESTEKGEDFSISIKRDDMRELCLQIISIMSQEEDTNMDKELIPYIIARLTDAYF